MIEKPSQNHHETSINIIKDHSTAFFQGIEHVKKETVRMALVNSISGDVKPEAAPVQSKSLENASDSEHTEKEIDRIIAEAFMLDPQCVAASMSPMQDAILQGESGGSRTEFEDEDPETLSMRLNLIESLQNKLRSVEREEGEVTDEDAVSGGQISSDTAKLESSLKTKQDENISSRKRSRRRGDSKSREKHRVSEKKNARTRGSSKHRSTPRAYLSSGRTSRSATSASKIKESDRKSRGSSSTHHSRHSRKSENKGKNESSSLKQPITELSITLPVQQCSSECADVVVTTTKDVQKATAERVVDTSKSSAGGENRCIKRLGDSGSNSSNLSITVNTHGGKPISSTRTDASVRPLTERIQLPDNSSLSQGSLSATRPSPRLPLRSLVSETLGVETDIPLPPPPVPPRNMTVSLPVEHDLLLLPPPPAPPIFPQTMGITDKCNPLSITVQVSKGGGRVAQLYASTRLNDASAQKRPETIANNRLEQPPPPPAPTEHFPDNYEDVGMDVESSRSSCTSDSAEEMEAPISPRHRQVSEADEEQLRQMLLNQVTLHRKRLAESATQSSNASICGHPEEESTRNQSVSTNEDEKKCDIKNVMPHATSTSEEGASSSTKESVICSTPLTNSQTNDGSSVYKRSRLNSFENHPKRRKLDESMVSEEYYSVKSPPCTSLSALETKIREHQSELSNLDEKISQRMSSLSVSLRRRTELRKQLAELEADIDADRVGCRLLMQRRNSLRRDVERYEESKLDLLLDNDCIDAQLYTSARVPRRSIGGNTKNVNNVDRSPTQGIRSSSQFESSSTRPSEENSSQEQVLSLEEEEMRLKLLARMKKDLQNARSEQKDEKDRATPNGSVEECCNQFTQTTHVEEEHVMSLYRLDSFPERLKRFVGVPPSMSLISTDCPSESSGAKCLDVFCKSRNKCAPRHDDKFTIMKVCRKEKRQIDEEDLGVDFKRGKTSLWKTPEEMGERARGKDKPAEKSAGYGSGKQNELAKT